MWISNLWRTVRISRDITSYRCSIYTHLFNEFCEQLFVPSGPRISFVSLDEERDNFFPTDTSLSELDEDVRLYS